MSLHRHAGERQKHPRRSSGTGSKESNATLTADECVCAGCLATTGRQIAHCSECKIRVCAIEKNVRNCAHCSDYPCQKLKEFFAVVPQAQVTLEEIRHTL